LGGALEDTSMNEVKAQFETNFFGAVRVMQAVISVMRKQRTGKVANITSMEEEYLFLLAHFIMAPNLLWRVYQNLLITN
jgi:NAD(P)-dependent dehydrogenase (short-subunit alcohol dehydrogenase family)